MEALEYLFSPVMKLLAHEFTILGYPFSFLAFWMFAVMIKVAHYAITNLFGGGD